MLRLRILHAALHTNATPGSFAKHWLLGVSSYACKRNAGHKKRWPALPGRRALQSREMGISARTFSGRFWALIGSTFLGFLGIGAVLPALGPHVRYDLGGSDQTVGFVIGVYSFVALGGRLFAGPLADRRGRKVAFLAGLFSCAVAGTRPRACWTTCQASCGRWPSPPGATWMSLPCA